MVFGIVAQKLMRVVQFVSKRLQAWFPNMFSLSSLMVAGCCVLCLPTRFQHCARDGAVLSPTFTQRM